MQEDIAKYLGPKLRNLQLQKFEMTVRGLLESVTNIKYSTSSKMGCCCGLLWLTVWNVYSTTSKQ